MTRNPVFQFVLWSLLLSHPVFAQEAIQIEIDSAPVEIELQKPAEPPAPPKPTTPPQAETKPKEGDKKVAEEESKGIGKYGVAIGIGALVAGILAALAGGGGGGGGSNTTPEHP
ncbi:MAG: hypothetical protein ACWGNB_04990 [Thiogranum sp.]